MHLHWLELAPISYCYLIYCNLFCRPAEWPTISVMPQCPTYGCKLCCRSRFAKFYVLRKYRLGMVQADIPHCRSYIPQVANVLASCMQSEPAKVDVMIAPIRVFIQELLMAEDLGGTRFPTLQTEVMCLSSRQNYIICEIGMRRTLQKQSYNPLRN